VRPEIRAGLRVETGGRLVEEDQTRHVDQAQRDVEPAPLAAGQGLHLGVGLVGQADQGDHLVDRQPPGVHPPVELDQLARAEVLVDPGLLEHDADAFAVVAPAGLRVEAEHLDVAGRAPPVTLEDLHGGRLPGAVRAEQCEHLPRLDRERQAVDGVVVSVVLVQAVHRDGRHGHPLELFATTSAHPRRDAAPEAEVPTDRDAVRPGPPLGQASRRRRTASANASPRAP